jgi:hypothetical protein
MTHTDYARSLLAKRYPRPVIVQLLRDRGLDANRSKTHCPRGHEYTPANTAVYGGKRFCVACAQERYGKLTEGQKERRRENNRRWRAKQAGAAHV